GRSREADRRAARTDRRSLSGCSHSIVIERPLALIAIISMIAVLCGVAGCTPAPLPEVNSDEARLYVQRCSQCHNAYNPHSLTAAMWRYQMDAMAQKIQQAGMPPLTDNERQTILEYVERNSAKQ